MLSPIDASIQTPELNRYLRQLTNQNKSFICTGDFNILRHKMSQKWFPSFKMTGIEDTSERYSYIYANKYTYTITGYGVVDHVLLSRDLTGFSSYSWKFADKQPSIYPTKRNIGDKWKISVACPDHAIMISHIERLPNE